MTSRRTSQGFAARQMTDVLARWPQERTVAERHPRTESAPEAVYWAGVSRYKATNDPKALGETEGALSRKYRESSWAKKASVWKFAISVSSREEVDAMVKKAIADGGSHVADSQDQGFMYVRTFYDLDGHHWEVFWMDPGAVQG